MPAGDIEWSDHGLAELDPPKHFRDQLNPPHEREGLSLIAGQRLRPWDTHSLFVLTLLNRGTLGSDADAAGNEEAAAFFRVMNEEIEAAVADSDEAKAVDAAATAHDDALPELEALERAAAEAEAAIATASVKDKQKARRAAEDAQATLADYRQHVATLDQQHTAATTALARKRQALRAEHIAQKRKELKARRASIREFASASLVTVGTQLIALEALEKALAK